MDSLPSSENAISQLSFLTSDGMPLDAPREWQTALVCVDASAGNWEHVCLMRHDMALPVSLRRIRGQVRIVAEWPRSGVGHYGLHLTYANASEQRTVTVLSEKLSPSATDRMLLDLETELPTSIALALQQLGAFAGLNLNPAADTTLAQEFVRLQRAVIGSETRHGLAFLLPQIARDPYQRLQMTDVWTPWERARRPHPARLPQAIAAGPVLALGMPPERVLDSRVEHTEDVYENQLLRTYYTQVDRRLRRLHKALRMPGQDGLQSATADLLSQLSNARRQASFLNDVSLPSHLPTQLTMVLQRRPEYRAVLEGYLELHRSPTIRLEDPALDAPFENIPTLYQTWGTLQVVAVLLDVALEAGFILKSQQLAGHDADGIFVRLLPDGSPIVTFVHPETGTRVRLIPERTYSSIGPLRSVSSSHRPDIAIEIIPRDASPRVILFDPKYKLSSDGQSNAETGLPLKADIDKMHTYRDAIRDANGQRVVISAHILYPGKTVLYGNDVGAIRAQPEHREALQHDLRQQISVQLK